jgi:hypothetical protein
LKARYSTNETLRPNPERAAPARCRCHDRILDKLRCRWRRARRGSALIYLAAIDITFNVERGVYRLLPASGAMVTEAVINVASLALGITTVTLCWRRALAMTGAAGAQRS